METEGSLPRSQQSATLSQMQPVHAPIHFLEIHFNIIPIYD